MVSPDRSNNTPNPASPATEMLDTIASAPYRSTAEVSHPGRELARRIAGGEKIPREDIDKVLEAAGVKYADLSATPEMQEPEDIPVSETVPEDVGAIEEESASVRALKRIPIPTGPQFIEKSIPNGDR